VNGSPTVGGLFDGCGLLAYGLHLAGWQHTWLCEVDEWRRGILAKRFPGVRIYDDVRAVDARADRPLLIAGGFPCKGASTAGKRNGFEHPETVLWREMARAVRDLRPRYVLVENVANLLSVRDGAVWGEVVGDLAALGFDIEWDCFPAAAFGAPHLRDRVIAVATHADRGDERSRLDEGRERTGRTGALGGVENAADAKGAGSQGARLRGRAAERGGRASANADGDGLREQPITEPGRSGAPVSGRPRPLAAVAGEQGFDRGEERDRASARELQSRHDAERLGVPVEWGKYEAAIRRWEAVVGTAPEPLCAFRGVDARAAATMERSRLSALGDGVQVQLAFMAGRHVTQREQDRLMRAAA
jgi:DNA (cytosine-5)-methyltransferase 1